MKKIITLCLLAVISLTTAFAQTEPNRLIVKQGYDHKSFIIDRVDSVFFDKVEGVVAAKVEFKKFNTGESGDTIWVAVTKTPECKAYRITCVPTTFANAMTTDAQVESYFNQTKENLIFDDFTNAQMTGFESRFSDNTEYTLLTIGYDRLGTACHMSKANFKTPRKEVSGSPDVKGVILETTPYSFKVKFTPNKDTKAYAICAFEKGKAEEQYNQFAPMFGFSNMGEMIKRFSQVAYEDEFINEWNKMTPNTEYEIYVQAWDKNDVFADMIIVPVKTGVLGGSGTATVEIEVKEFKLQGDQYTQRVIYTPNDQTALHRDIIIEKDAYNSAEWGEAKLLSFLKEDRPQDPQWNQYGVDDATWTVQPNSSYYACSIAQNANGEWGPLTMKEFSTPEEAGAPAKKVAPKKIVVKTTNGVTKITTPENYNVTKTIKLEQK